MYKIYTMYNANILRLLLNVIVDINNFRFFFNLYNTVLC
jgi:hypothetical protein